MLYIFPDVPTISMLPDFNPYIIYEGQRNIVISCKVVAANPSKNLVYVMMNSMGNSYNSTLSMSIVKTNHRGNYSCIVNNAAGNSSVFKKNVIVHCKYMKIVMKNNMLLTHC